MRRALLAFLYVTVPVLVAVLVFAIAQWRMTAPVDSSATKLQLFEVPEAASFSSIAQRLESDGYIRSATMLSFVARLRGDDRAVLAGEYEISPSMSSREILSKLSSGKTYLRKFTVKEGVSVREIGALLEAAGITTKALFDQALNDPKNLSALNVHSPSLEGYLFPETYQFPKNTAPQKILAAMHDQLEGRWKDGWNNRMKELGMTKHDVLTLASIIEKETGVVEEQPVISSVFHNRLKTGMRLQADPTVIYGIPNFTGNITKEDLQAPSPYNTYVIDGLPPTPIGNPGLTAIEAALYPSTTDYLYFVADGTGRHVFSVKLDDHNNAVNEFQKTPARAARKAAAN